MISFNYSTDSSPKKENSDFFDIKNTDVQEIISFNI